MKRVIGILITILCALPMHAQYLLEEGYKQQNQNNEEQTYRQQYSEGKSSFGNNYDATVTKGYRGFADITTGFCLNNAIYNRSTISTTQGYQFIDDYLFAGGGIGISYFYGGGIINFPIFVAARSDFYNFGNWLIFADLKIGYEIGSSSGFFTSPQVGLRYKLTEKLGLNVGLGFSFHTYSSNEDDEYDWYNEQHQISLTNLNIRVGIDF